MKRFGKENKEEIRKEIQHLIPNNTRRSKASVWRQFLDFCDEKSYTVDDQSISVEGLASILEDYAFNMKKRNSEDYKESVVKLMWNSTAKQLQELFYVKYKIKFDPFCDVEFATARAARDAKRRQLQKDPSKRKQSSSALSETDFMKIVQLWDENTPQGLQHKFFYIVSHELAWRGGEGTPACIEYFEEETDSQGNLVGRIEYNPVFSKTTQGGSKKLADSKWLVTNKNNPDICPVRLFKKLMEKRGDIKTNLLFLTPNPNWKDVKAKGWYKNCPVGRNTISTWFKSAALKVGIDTKKMKITNHSGRATAVSKLAKKGVGEQQLIKMTGHSNSQSIKPYLQMDVDHHRQIVEAMRSVPNTGDCKEAKKNFSESHQSSTVYNNCVFHITTTNNNNN